MQSGIHRRWIQFPTPDESGNYSRFETCNELHYYELAVLVTYGLGIRFC